MLGVGNTWWEVEGATLVDLPTAKALHDGGAIFIDRGDDAFWRARHVPGAIHLPWGRSLDPNRVTYSKAALRQVAGPDDEIVFYGTEAGGYTTAAWEAAKAIAWGFKKVYLFDGGAQAWEEAGYPIETGE